MSVSRNVLAVPRIRGPERLRFVWHIRFTEDCWEWKGRPNHGGYGIFHPRGETKVLAHRYSYELFVGQIPEGFHVDHLCRNPICVNPLHLEAVTPAENNRRSTSPTATNARKTHCKWGHEFTPENTRASRRRDGNTGRHCRMCEAIRDRGGSPERLAAARAVGAQFSIDMGGAE